MTHVHVTAILMALAPAAPKSFEHEPQPERPYAADYLADEVWNEANGHEYDNGEFTGSLGTEVRILAEWFEGEGGTENMDAAPAIEEAIKSILDQHPDTDKEALNRLGEQLIDALERFAEDYRRFVAAEDSWAASREMAWRTQWAQGLLSASRELAATEA